MDDNDVYEEDVEDNPRYRLQSARLFIGIIGLIVIGLEFFSARSDHQRVMDDPDASAIQVIQIWTPHLFYMMTAIGVLIALYIMTRYRD